MDRRTFSRLVLAGTAAAALPAAPASASAPASGSAHFPAHTLKQVKAGVLNVGYAESGPSRGPVVILLHGFPYDIQSFGAVAPLLAARGYRVIVPYLRGHGTTRFLSDRTFRNGQQAAVALDILALMDALMIEKAVIAGFDWGSRTADIIAALWPGRCKALVSVSGYLITDLAKNKEPLPPQAEYAWWYQYYFATERGRLGLERYRDEFVRLLWKTVSPTWKFDDATFERTAASFTNPDWVPVVIHNYRWRLSLAEGEPRYDDVERRLAGAPKIAVPTITIDAELDPFTPAGNGSGYRDRFTGAYEHRALRGVGHNVPQEAPRAFAEAVIDADRL
ncbi:alpha/beta hydrolase [Sphaerisporangium melleum]|uniref:Alpha/beta hydrolase n=1 Tax=Sphaerisporangium melleum TaxID=321316 RepID=A0A917RFV4_9ACTN|nr:alpha/beta hydrolase [Sphaerisporangium melleum]GGL04479.1 alpha/beta hydrolase [Sphaerisporangium melleum]GII74124.1 alpha/beta hydrolase [Sphaerisporangium melleum]